MSTHQIITEAQEERRMARANEQIARTSTNPQAVDAAVKHAQRHWEKFDLLMSMLRTGR